jgi:hypothetical protein
VTIEVNKGKARPRLPRSRDLSAVPRPRDPSEGRDEHGHFSRGNRARVGRGEVRVIGKLLGATENQAAIVARDAVRIQRAVMRDMPSDAALVRSLASLLGRHLAIVAYASAKADSLGLDTPDAQKWLEVALRHGARAERLSVTALDIATKLAAGAAPADAAPWVAAVAEAADDAPKAPEVVPAPSTRPEGAGGET